VEGEFSVAMSRRTPTSPVPESVGNVIVGTRPGRVVPFARPTV